MTRRTRKAKMVFNSTVTDRNGDAVKTGTKSNAVSRGKSNAPKTSPRPKSRPTRKARRKSSTSRGPTSRPNNKPKSRTNLTGQARPTNIFSNILRGPKKPKAPSTGSSPKRTTHKTPDARLATTAPTRAKAPSRGSKPKRSSNRVDGAQRRTSRSAGSFRDRNIVRANKRRNSGGNR